MGLFSMLKDTATAIADMGQMSKLQDHLTGLITKYHESGQLPDEVWSAYEKFTKESAAVSKDTDTADASKKSLAAIHDFVGVLEQHEDKLPANLKDEVEKFVKAANGLETLTDKILK